MSTTLEVPELKLANQNTGSLCCSRYSLGMLTRETEGTPTILMVPILEHKIWFLESGFHWL